jgi:hypothetical protein
MQIMNQLLIVAAISAKQGILPIFLYTVLPFILVCSLLVYLLHYSQKKYRKHLDRSLAHMDALEKKTDRMIELLEKIEQRK